jgi:hypothetical protein
MFDEIKIKGNHNIPLDSLNIVNLNELLGIEFVPLFQGNMELSYYKAIHRNLLIKIYREEIEITNSLTVYKHGHNAFNLMFSESLKVIKEITKMLNVNPEGMFLKKLAIGFNLQTDVSPLDIINNYQKHGAKHLFPMQWGGKVYGGKFIHVHSEFKAYDKGWEQLKHYRRKLNVTNLLRLEIVLKNVKIPKQIGTLKDLMNKDNWHLLFKLFIKEYDLITKKPIIDFSSLSPNKMAIQIAKEDPRYWESMKKRNKETYKKSWMRYKKELLQYDNTIHNKIKDSIIDQFEELINDTFKPAFCVLLYTTKKGTKLINN